MHYEEIERFLKYFKEKVFAYLFISVNIFVFIYNVFCFIICNLFLNFKPVYIKIYHVYYRNWYLILNIYFFNLWFLFIFCFVFYVYLLNFS